MGDMDVLRSVLKSEIKRFDDESLKHKRIYRRTQTAVIGLTALSTIVAAAGLILPPGAGRAVQFAVVCLTASTAAIASWAEMRKARELWQHEREVYYALLDIQRGVEFIAGSRPLSEQEVQDAFDRITAILGSSTQKWARIQEKKGT